jgi:putative nucleotidyltransferase with HDIG domain
MNSEHPILRKLRTTRELPSLPVVLIPLLRYLERPLDSQDVHQIVSLISQDKSLAARCLQVANSPLFGCAHQVENIQSAVVALGLERIHEIAVSCSLLKLLPASSTEVNPSVFWAHSMASALVSQDFARKIGFADPMKAYAAALLHDVGIVALLWLAPEDYRIPLRIAREEHISLYEAEQRAFAFSHVDAGRIIAESWRLPADIVEVIAHHHAPQEAREHPALASIVWVSDNLCRLSGMGYGHTENRQTNFAQDPAAAVLASQFPSLRPFDWARFTFESEGLVEEVQSVVSRVYGRTQ